MSSTPVSDAARAAFEPVRAREQAHAVALLDERKRRGEHHFQRVFGVPQTAVLESGSIMFTVEGHRLQYVGNLREDARSRRSLDGRVKPRFVGPGWMLLEKCAGCKQEHAIAFIGRLQDLGRIIEEGYPEWDCPTCAMQTSPPAGKGFLRR